MFSIGVLGAGSWGTALAKVLSENGHTVHLWSHEQVVTKEILEKKENTLYLPHVKLQDNIIPTDSLSSACLNKDIIISVSPSHAVRSVLTRASKFIKSEAIIVSATKGFESASKKLMSDVIAEVLPQNSIVVLSGPSFAIEVAKCVPTVVVAASKDKNKSSIIQKIFANNYFRVYTSTDPLGVELGASLKNVIAIASGICHGLGFGYNTQAALIARGLVEMVRLGIRMNANRETFFGLSGVGDMVLTCTGDLSRNRTVGIMIGKGKKINQILSESKMTCEGADTAKSLHEISKKLNIELPIINEVYKVLFEDKDPRTSITELMLRELKEEQLS
jgi:glycerol-3-phosphate dehydrogenase (NAD(P)+)